MKRCDELDSHFLLSTAIIYVNSKGRTLKAIPDHKIWQPLKIEENILIVAKESTMTRQAPTALN
jgi:hypothetical protein